MDDQFVGVANCLVFSIAHAQTGPNQCPLYGVAGCPLFRGFQCMEVYGEAIGTFRIVRYIVGVRY